MYKLTSYFIPILILCTDWMQASNFNSTLGRISHEQGFEELKPQMSLEKKECILNSGF